VLHMRRNNPRNAFTLLELLVVIVIIATLISILLVGFGAARRAARAAGDRQAVSGLDLAVTQFDNDNGFIPPLVFDGEPQEMTATRKPEATEAAGGEGPVFEVEPDQWVVSVWDAGSEDGDDLEVLRQRNMNTGEPLAMNSGQEAWADPRYSRYALAYYLAGALPAEVDGVDGLGMYRPQEGGGFRGVGAVVGRGRTTVDPYIETGAASVNIKQNYVDANEYAEHGLPVLTQDEANDVATDSLGRFRTAVTDRNGVAYRYYRWEKGRRDGNLPDGRPNIVVERTLDLNIPAALTDPALRFEGLSATSDAELEIDVTAGDTELRGARYAIVGAGEDGLFGTEDIDVILEALGRSAGTSLSEEGQAELRRQVWKDNVMEVGG